MAREQTGLGNVVTTRRVKSIRGSARLLLLLPFIGVLWSPPFEQIAPTWYLGFWIAVSAASVYAIYRAEN